MHGAAFFCFGARRGILENFRGRGAPGQPFASGSGRGVHPWFRVLNQKVTFGVLNVPGVGWGDKVLNFTIFLVASLNHLFEIRKM